MNQEQLDELKKIAQSYQDKYVYYYLALAVTAIGFTFTQTQNMENFHWIDIPLGISIICWGFSFWVGTRNREINNSLIYGEYDLKKMESHRQSLLVNDPESFESEKKILTHFMESNHKNKQFSIYLQRNYFFVGIISFVIWRVLDIAIS